MDLNIKNKLIDLYLSGIDIKHLSKDLNISLYIIKNIIIEYNINNSDIISSNEIDYSNQIEKLHHKQYYLDNKEHFKEYRENNKEHFKEYRKEYYEDNKDHILNYSKERYKNNKEYYKKYSKQYQQTDKGKESDKKSKARRKRNMGFIPLNYPFDNAHAHHINNNYVIYIPKQLHYDHYGHNHNKPDTMTIINKYAWNYLFNNIDYVNIKNLTNYIVYR